MMFIKWNKNKKDTRASVLSSSFPNSALPTSPTSPTKSTAGSSTSSHPSPHSGLKSKASNSSFTHQPNQKSSSSSISNQDPSSGVSPTNISAPIANNNGNQKPSQFVNGNNPPAMKPQGQQGPAPQGLKSPIESKPLAPKPGPPGSFPQQRQNIPPHQQPLHPAQHHQMFNRPMQGMVQGVQPPLSTQPRNPQSQPQAAQSSFPGQPIPQQQQQQQQQPPQQPTPRQQQQLQKPYPFTQPSAAQQVPQYPWSQRTISNVSPFPRYGHAANHIAARDGEVFVMGGLKGSNVFGDLWVIETDTLTGYLLETEGCPSPRVGHSSLCLGNAFIVFGGDTKVEETDVLDDNLYLLNTNTLKWTIPQPVGPRPSGRYGHTISTIGSTLYVFGGQYDDYFFDDLVSYDLSTLQSSNSKWVSIKPTSPSPPPRTNHTMITFEEKLYLFGGTDGKLWYSDTWCYDPRSNTWTQIDCAGYIPSPCEGHSATIVGDIMYVFGGRSSEGKDLGSLSALKIPSRKWFSFQNMGPGPSPRSGHSMTAFAGHKILIMGGECPEFDPLDPSGQEIASTNLVYVLDTSRINYPPSASEAAPGKKAIEDNTNGTINVPAILPQRNGPQQQVYNNVAPPPPYGTTYDSPGAKKEPFEKKNRIRSESTVSELTPGFGYERVDVGDSRSLTDESDSYQDSTMTSPQTNGSTPNSSHVQGGKISPTQHGDIGNQPEEEDDDTAMIHSPPQEYSSHDTTVINSSQNLNAKLAPPISASNSGTSSQYSSDTVTGDSVIVSSPVDTHEESNAFPILAASAGAGVVAAANLAHNTFNDRTSLEVNEVNDVAETEPTYQPHGESETVNKSLSDPVIPGSLPIRNIQNSDVDNTELVIALNELKNELAQVQSNIKKQAEQASEKISEIEAERDSALEKAKRLEAGKSPNSEFSTPETERKYQDEISELKRQLEELQHENQTTGGAVAGSRAFSGPYDPERDYDQIRSRNINLEQQVRELSDKHILANHESTRLRTQLDDVLARYKTLEDSTEDHVNTLAAATLTLSATQTKLREADKLLTLRNEEKGALLKQVAELTSELEITKANYKSAQDLIDQTRSFSVASPTDNANIDALNGNVNRIIAMWAGAKMFESASKNHDGTERSIDDDGELEEIETPKVKALKSQLDEVHQLYNTHQKASKEFAYELSATLEQVSVLKQELSESEEKRQASEKETEELKAELADKHKELEDHVTKLTTSQQSLEEYHEKLQQTNFEKEDKVGDLELKAKELEEELVSTKLELQDYEDKYLQLESEYNSTVSYTTTSEKALSKTREELAKLREQNSKLQEEVNNLKIQVEDEDEDNESVTSRGLRGDNDSVYSGTNKYDRSGGSSRLSSASRLNSRQIDLQLRDLKARIIILQEEKDDLQSKSLDLKKRLITQDDELKDAHEEIEHLVRENQSLLDHQQEQQNQHYPTTPPRSAASNGNGNGAVSHTTPNSSVARNASLNSHHQAMFFGQSESPVNPDEADQTLNSLSSELDQIRNNRERLSGLLNNNVNSLKTSAPFTPSTPATAEHE